MDIFVSRFDSEEAPLLFGNIDEEEKIPDFKQRVADAIGLPVA